MSNQANKTDGTRKADTKKAGKIASTDGKQKMSEKELQAIGLDPAVYGYTKK